MTTADAAVTEDALDLKLRAIALVEGMRYPDPDRTPPGKDLRKEEILLALRASTDGLYRTDGFLEGSAPFEQDVNAARRLLQLAADPHVDTAVVSAARQALDLLVQADRLLVVDLLDATGIFSEPFPAAATLELERARQELAKGDERADRGQPADALHAYTKAYRYAEQAGRTLFAAFDPDGDDLPQVQEERLGTQSDRADSDGDGLADGVEALRTGTDPLDTDTRDTGVPDGDKDVDTDGLTHLREAVLGSDPLRADTDGDSAADGAEGRGRHGPDTA
ncbi:MAG: hypothetical protein M3P48_08315 [Actinomycetota bacterium]|nr:hypothetical protein [Actinomycetota bacterium]